MKDQVRLFCLEDINEFFRASAMRVNFTLAMQAALKRRKLAGWTNESVNFNAVGQ